MSASTTTGGTHNPSRIEPRVVVAGGVGSIIEYFDFGVYGYVAVILAAHFFSAEDPLVGLLSTLATFAVAFVLRPIGAIVFGHFGDRYGRKNALAGTVILMAIASGMIGVLPSYAAIGVGATALLVLARCLQGLAAGGELGGAASFVAEKSPNHLRGLFCSTTQTGAIAGSLLASVTVTLLNLGLGEEVMQDWGWRIPFLIAIPVGLFGLWVRHGLEESEQFKTAQDSMVETKKAQQPVAVLLKEYPKQFLITLGLSVLLFSAYYIAYVYVNIHMQQTLKFDANFAYMSTTTCLFVSMLMMPVFGWMADKVGRKPMFIGASIAGIVLAAPCFMLFEHGGAVAVISHIVLGLVDSALMGVALSTFAELFPTHVRYTGIAFGFSLGAAITGGTSPYIATWLVATTGNHLAAAFFMMGTAVITLLTAFALKETKGISLQEVK